MRTQELRQRKKDEEKEKEAEQDAATIEELRTQLAGNDTQFANLQLHLGIARSRVNKLEEEVASMKETNKKLSKKLIQLRWKGSMKAVKKGLIAARAATPAKQSTSPAVNENP